MNAGPERAAMLTRTALALALPLALIAGSVDAGARPFGEEATSTCDLVESSAAEHGLPVDYFTRLIWRESSFRADVVSPVGAAGIAQFMPGTAAERGLLDPFDPVQAIPASAQLLKALADRFGNLGLAAAAYNAGPRRVEEWLAGAGGLPLETRSYVAAVTGKTAEAWRDGDAEPPGEAEPGVAFATCLEVLSALDAPPPAAVAFRTPERGAQRQPWGVQVAGNFSQSKALSAFHKLQQRHAAVIGDEPPLIVRKRMSLGPRPMVHVRIPAPTREAANDLCRRLREDGAPCIVLKN